MLNLVKGSSLQGEFKDKTTLFHGEVQDKTILLQGEVQDNPFYFSVNLTQLHQGTPSWLVMLQHVLGCSYALSQ